MSDQCIYCQSTWSVYLSECEDCAVAKFDAENAYGRGPASQGTPTQQELAYRVAMSSGEGL